MDVLERPEFYARRLAALLKRKPEMIDALSTPIAAAGYEDLPPLLRRAYRALKGVDTS